MKIIFKELKKNIVFLIIIDLILWASLFIGYLKPIRERYPIKIDKLTFKEINNCKLTKKLENVERRVFLDGLDTFPPIDEYINLSNEVEVVINKDNDTRNHEKWATASITFDGSYDSRKELDEFLSQIVPQEELEKSQKFYMIKNNNDIYISIKSKSEIQLTFVNFSMPYSHNYKEGITYGSGKAKKNLKEVGKSLNEYFLTIEKINVKKTLFKDILENLKIIVVIAIIDIIIIIHKIKKEN